MTNQEIKNTGLLIKNEQHIGGNTALRVGGVIEGIGYALDNKDAANGYYQATINEGSISVNAPNFVLGTGGNLRLKMPAAGTTASTLTIGNANAVQLWYNGAAVSAQNTWEQDEIISVFYDGTRFMASNSQGGGGKAEKIKYDNSHSGLAAENVQGAVDEVGEDVENLNFNVFQRENITGGIITGSRVNLNGEITSSASSQRTDYIDLTGVDKVYVTTCIVKLASGNDETITLYDSSKNPIRIIKPADFGLANGEYKVLTDYPINVNDDEKYIIVSGRYNIEGAVGLNVTHLTEKESDVTETLDIKWQQTSLGNDYLPSANLNKTRNAALVNVSEFNRITLNGSADEIYVNCYLLDSSYNLITSYDNPWALSRDISIGDAVYMSMACKKGSAGTATLNVGDNTLVVTGYKSAKEKITELDGYIQQLGSECENIEETTEELTGAIGTWNGSNGSIGTRAATRAHLRISACNVNKMKIVIPSPYYASFFYVDANNISQGQVGTDMGTGTQELELSGEYDLMATIKYQAAGTTTITATMLAATPFHVTTYSMNGYDPAAPYSELAEVKEQAFARTSNVINLDSLDIQMLGLGGSGYVSSAIRAAGVLSNNFGKNAVINAAFTSGKMMFHFWNASEEGATIYSLNTTTDTYIGETGWTGTSEVTQVPEECNVIVCLFDATSVSQARSIITSAIISSDVPISNRVSTLENKVDAIGSNAILGIFKKYRNLTIPNDAQTEVVVMENGDKITHDATHIVKDGKAYVIYCANPHDTGDSGEFSNYAVVRLDIYDVSNGIANAILHSRQIIGGNGYAVGGSTINGGAGVPNAYLVGNIIHIIFGAKIESTWTEIHCTYDTSTSTLGSLEQCTMDSSPLTGSVLATHSSLASSFNYQLSFNASIAEIAVGGTTYYYACICSAARIANGLIVRTTDFKDWEFVTEPSFTGNGAQYEGAMGAYDGYLYLALRQNVSGTVPNGMLLAKLETDGSIVEYKYLTACNSRPAFYNQDGLLYLIVPSGTRSTATFYRVNGSVNDLTEIAEIAGDNNTFGQYLEVVPTSPQYVTYTNANGYSYSYVRLFASDVIAGDEDVLETMLSKLGS